MEIIKNAIKCKKCGDEIESKNVHDFRFASVVQLPLTEGITTYVDVGIVKIGKKCL